MTRLNDSSRDQDSDFLAKIALLPNLTDFTLLQQFASHAECLSNLAPCPSLTNLTLLDDEWSSCLPKLILFPGLRRLTILRPSGWWSRLHAALAASVNLHRTLEHLTLDEIHRDHAIGDLAESMAKFTRLASVVLRRVIDPDVWLTALLAAPALASLLLDPLAVHCVRCVPARYLPDEQHTAGALSRLMVAKPSLKLTLIVWGRGMSPRAQPAPYHTHEELRREPTEEVVELGLSFARLLTETRLVQMPERFLVQYL